MTKVSVTGIVSDQYGSVLAIKRDDSRMWAPPGGALDMDELPSDGVVREVEEETGYKVIPLRLVCLEHVMLGKQPYLGFVFRCLKRSGALRTSAESLEVGLIPPKEFGSVRMLSLHRARVEAALRHAADVPEWTERTVTPLERVGIWGMQNLIYPCKNLWRKVTTGVDYVPTARWNVSVSAVIRNAHGDTFWTDNHALPHGNVEVGEAPWEAIMRHVSMQGSLGEIALVDLAAVFVQPNAHMHLVWLAHSEHVDRLTEGGWHSELPDDADQLWLDRLAIAADPMRDTTQFQHE